MVSRLGRDIFNAQQRIFDHRAFVNGAVNNFVNEFELKRNEAEVETLFKVTEIVVDLKYDLSERCTVLSSAHLSELNREPEEFIVNSRAEHKRNSFNEDSEHKYERIKNSFQESEEEIDELYSDLQVKLNIEK